MENKIILLKYLYILTFRIYVLKMLLIIYIHKLFYLD